MLDINIYGKYEVFFYTKGSTQVGFDEFERYEYTDSRTFSGFDLITMLSRAMTSQGLMSMVIKDKKIYMEFFNPTTGEGHDTVYTINEVGGMV